MIDAGGRAQTLNTRDIGPRGFVEGSSSASSNAPVFDAARRRGARGARETFGFDAAFALDDRYGDPLSLSGDPSSDALDRRARRRARRFWLRSRRRAWRSGSLRVVVVVAAATAPSRTRSSSSGSWGSPCRSF